MFFSTCLYLWGNSRVRLATQRKSLRKFNLWPLVTTCESVWPGLNVWNWCNIIKCSFLRVNWHFLSFFMQWDYGKFILKQLDYSPSFSTSDSQLGCASLTICSKKTQAHSLIVNYPVEFDWQQMTGLGWLLHAPGIIRTQKAKDINVSPRALYVLIMQTRVF